MNATFELEFSSKRNDPRNISAVVNPSAWYRCHICMIRDDVGTVSAIVLNLPGCGSCGDTEEEALQNVREAIAGVIGSYRDEGARIPWIDSMKAEVMAEVPKGATLRWIVVNV